MTKRFQLEGLEMDEVSFVDMGDDPEAKICLFKRAGEVVDAPTYDDVLDGEVVDATEDDGELYVTTDVGKVYFVDEFSTALDGDEEVMVVDKATLLYDPEDDEPVEYGEIDDPMPTEGLMQKMMDGMSTILEYLVPGGAGEVEKGKFAQAMQASIADQAYSELSAMCSALKGAIDADLFGGSDAQSMIESVDEFSDTLKKAISDKWTKGQLIGKQAADPELVAHAEQRDRELLAGNTDEGGASSGVNAALRKDADDTGDEGGNQMAGMDRSQMTPGQIAYQDALESGHTPEEAAQAQAQAEANEGGEGAEGGETPPEETTAPTGEVDDTQPADPPPGTNPDDVVGDTGSHTAPFEKMLENVPEPIAKVLRVQRAEIQKYAQREEESVYINKARGFQHLPVNPAEMGPVLHRIAKGRSGEDDEKFVVDTMRACEEMAKQGASLMRASGVGAGPGALDVGRGNAEAEVMKKARAVASEKQIPLEIAFAEVRQDPDNEALVSRYNEEVQG